MRQALQFQIPNNSLTEYIDILLDYANQCESVIEIGTGTYDIDENNNPQINSLYIWLASKVKLINTYDLVYHKDIELAIEVGELYNTKIHFHAIDPDFKRFKDDRESILLSDINYKADLLFLDGKHTYQQVKAELFSYSGNITKFIAIRGTHVFGYPFATKTVSKYPGDAGIQLAILEFLFDRKNWILDKHIESGCGLTILKRVANK